MSAKWKETRTFFFFFLNVNSHLVAFNSYSLLLVYVLLKSETLIKFLINCDLQPTHNFHLEPELATGWVCSYSSQTNWTLKHVSTENSVHDYWIARFVTIRLLCFVIIRSLPPNFHSSGLRTESNDMGRNRKNIAEKTN